MTQYVMIQNRGEIPLRGVRLLGMSNKSDEQIGQFGTGLKEAIALLARRGVALTIYSGETPISFEAQDVDGEREIMFRVGDGDWQAMNLHVNFGQRDWTEPWQALREITCNAIDEGIDDLHHEVTSDVHGVAGATRVYVEADFDILESYSQLPKRLMMLSNREPLWRDSYHGDIYAKNGNPSCQIFHRGVWVQESEEPSLFDYEMRKLSLNESRSCSWYEVHSEMAILVAIAPSSVIARLLIASQQPEFESLFEGKHFNPSTAAALAKSYSKASDWQEAWDKAFGDGAVACYPTHHLYEKLIKRGYAPKPFPSTWFKLFRAVGIKTHDEILDESDRTPMQVIPDATAPQFNHVWDCLDLLGFTDSKDRPPVVVFREVGTEEGGRRNGFYANGTVYVNEDIIGSREERVTCLEEAIHYITDKPDCSIDLQNWLMDRLDRTLFEMERLMK